MDAISWDEARANLIELALPPVLLDIFEGRVPGVLQWQFRCPWELFDDLVSLAPYPPGRITPLWSDHTGAQIVGYRHDGGPPGFLRFFLEVIGDGHAREEGLSYPQALVRPLVMIWESADDDEDPEPPVREAAALLGFEAVESLLRARAAAALPTFEAFDAWYRDVLAGLPAFPGRSPT